MIKDTLRLYNKIKNMEGLLVDHFDTVLAEKCKHFRKDEHDYCDHPDGDGFCSIDLCPLG